ncbi:hypothetical protein [Streptomyces sp. SID3343]|uniref:YunG family protein n=1 Tax=Streptomyces sp. SID3343 TaxID=2690260 RepID=UPI001F399F81|nr:hypothetical protein [Streptomyces sp. SID3343]
MTPWTLRDIENAIRAGWDADTCASEDLPKWHTGNPARGQCAVSALVVHDLLGGELMRGEVRVGGEHTDFHWWNRFAGVVEMDLTREQFAPEEIVGPGTPVERPTDAGRHNAKYRLLRTRTLAALGAGGRAEPADDPKDATIDDATTDGARRTGEGLCRSSGR